MATWMNEYEIEDHLARRANHPTLGPLVRTLANLVEEVNGCSDGWPYWKAPAKAAAKAMDLLMGNHQWEAVHGDRPEVTITDTKAALRPIKAFRTKHKLTFDIIEP